MVPVIALVGRPNVGKSTLFNRLTKSRDAIVAEYAGLTRDRQYGEAKWQGRTYIVIDTGGISGDEEGIDAKMAEQSLQAIEEADAVLFMVDSRAGLTAADQMIGEHLRKRNKRCFLVANKVDSVDPDIARAEFSPLGLGDALPIAAAHGRGISHMLEQALGIFPKDNADENAEGEEGGELAEGEEVVAEGQEPKRIPGPSEKEGIKIAIIGRPNVGKSTLVNLLLRLYDLESGRILIDGQNVAEVSQESLRANIGVVTQDTALLHRSIRDNLRYGKPDASEEELWAAARKARADAFIKTLDDSQGGKGFEAMVGERGVKLSGGQRQRIAIARVLLKDAPILVLDEATSALDSEVEAAIQESLDTLMEGKTVIAIAHRLSTIARMDRLVVIDKGQVIETGTHAELIARGGLYARLWQHQTGGFVGVD